ncbi:MAG: class I SAM-dependent methyltransferase [Actinomycetota bacterium]
MDKDLKSLFEESIYYDGPSDQLLTNERIVEIPFVFQNIPSNQELRILDFGCARSRLPIELASLGHRVVGVDLTDYDLKHPNFEFVKGDFLKDSFQSGSFDVVSAVSAIEHCGLGAYGEEPLSNGDFKVVQEISRVLTNDGMFILTIPFGRRMQSSWYRVYDDEALVSLLDGFTIEKEKYFKGLERLHWIPATKTDLLDIDSVSNGYVQAVACIVARKVRK